MFFCFRVCSRCRACRPLPDKLRRGVPYVVPVPYHIPVLVLSVDPHGGPIRNAGNYGGIRSGAAAEVQGAAAGVDRGLPGIYGPDEGDAEIVGEAEDQVPGDLRDVVLNPAGVLIVVVVPDLQQHGGEFGIPNLPQAGGGAGHHLVGQGIDAPQVVDEDLGRPLALGAGGVVEGDDAADVAVVALRGGVGVEGQVEVVPALVGLPDGAAGGHVGGIALIADAAAVEVGDHGVRQPVHPVFLTAGAGDVHVVFLRTGNNIMKIFF